MQPLRTTRLIALLTCAAVPVGANGVAYAVDIDAGLLKVVERSAKEAGIYQKK
jgi:hypothetical protein